MKLFPVFFAFACLVSNFPAIEVRSEDHPRTIGLICKHFCSDVSYSYDLTDFYDYLDYWRNIGGEDGPKIFCKLCKKKMETTTTASATVGSSTAPGTTETSTGPATDTNTETTTTIPTTSASTTTEVSTTTDSGN